LYVDINGLVHNGKVPLERSTVDNARTRCDGTTSGIYSITRVCRAGAVIVFVISAHLYDNDQPEWVNNGHVKIVHTFDGVTMVHLSLDFRKKDP